MCLKVKAEKPLIGYRNCIHFKDQSDMHMRGCALNTQMFDTTKGSCKLPVRRFPWA